MTRLRIALVALLVPFGVFSACATPSQLASAGSGGSGGFGGGSGGVAGSGGLGGKAGQAGHAHDAGKDAPADTGPDGPVACTGPADCASFGDTCAKGACVNNLCVKKAANEGGACDDGLFCTENDLCMAGVCVGGTQHYCPPMGFCDMGACDEATKSCKNSNANEGGSCPFSDPCVQNGVCASGKCEKGPATDCSFLASACATAVCDPVKGCIAIPMSNGAMCNDGMQNSCSQGICAAGACTPTPLPDLTVCDDGLGSVCSVGSCMAGNCVSEPANNGMSCTDFNIGACQVGVCGAGTCQPQPAMEGATCDDLQGNPCTQGYCVQGNCTSEPLANGTACDDMNFCTVADKCTAGVCNGDPNPCPLVNQPCDIGICSNAAQSCLAAPGNNGASCAPTNPCMVNGTCGGGSCAGGVPGNEGTACNDGNSCDQGATCKLGTCGNPVSSITMCANNDGCCPPGCTLATDNDCIYWMPGVQQNVAMNALAGWTQCYAGSYQDFETPTLTQVLTIQCTGAKLLLACAPSGSQTLSVLAMADRASVLFPCGTAPNCTKQANGVGWYYDTGVNVNFNDSSWGFAPGGQAVNRQANQGDILNPASNDRVSWGTLQGALDFGDRCGSSMDSTYSRYVYQAN